MTQILIKDKHRKGDWMWTYTGRKYWPLDPHPEDICIEDVAHSLSMQCRFGGHIKEFYSVAQHSVIVSCNCSVDSAPAGLLHDSGEAYLHDFIRPIKNQPQFAFYKVIEELNRRTIFMRFKLSLILPDDVNFVDDMMCVTEKRDLFLKPPPIRTIEDRVESYHCKIIPVSQPIAKDLFLLIDFNDFSQEVCGKKT